jgi:ABC-type Fe3+-siderophore transport system, permease component
VALLAPHIARQLVGPSLGPLAAAAALTDSLMVVVADAVARTAFAPLDIPVGVFTAAVGTPFFLYLLVRHRNR